MALFRWTDAEVRRALALDDATGLEDREYLRVSTDSRQVRDGDLFVALEGPNFDGNEYVDEALAGGARGAVASRGASADAPVYLVPDTLDALGRLASHRRAKLDAKVVGVTGSSGKTSTKELIRAALAARLRVHATEGNLNNRVGLPLTILAAPDEADALVLEMGTSEPGEIGALTSIASPDVGVITTVSETHLEGLGSLDGVLDEKLDLLRGLGPDADALVGERPAELVHRAREVRPSVRVAGFSTLADEDLRPGDATMRPDGCWSFMWRDEQVTLRTAGRHPVTNGLLALAVAEGLGIDAPGAAEAVSSVEPGPMRGERRTIGGITLLLDCYNANPQSTRAALDVLESLRGHRRTVAVLGSMLELGTQSDALHEAVLDDAASKAIDLIVATGEFAKVAAGQDSVRTIREEDPRAAYELLRPELRGDEIVLLKGSRGVALERLVKRFEADFGEEGE